MTNQLKPYFEVGINPVSQIDELTVLFAGESQTSPSHILGPQVLDYFLVHVALSGRGFFVSRGKTYELQAGDTFAIFPGELVSYGSDAECPWRYRWFALQGSHAEKLLGQASLTREAPVLQNKRNRRLLAYYRQTIRVLLQAEHRSALQAEAYIRLIVAEYMAMGGNQHIGQESITGMSKQVEQAIHWFTHQYPQPISIETVASTLGYHRTHFCKIFKEQTGFAPLSYLTNIRMEKAKQLLIDEQLTIQQVASSVGYPDALYFSKQFKKWMNCTPSEYRLRVKKSKG